MSDSRSSAFRATPYDVAVVGLGPVGAALAGLLASFGVRVLAVDQAREVHALPRALGMDHEAMRVFQQLGVTDALAPYVSAYRSTEYRTDTGEVIRGFESQPPPTRWAGPLT